MSFYDQLEMAVSDFIAQDWPQIALKIRETFTAYEEWLILYVFIANSFYMIILILGYFNARKKYIENEVKIFEKMAPLKALKPISILVPAYNEEVTVTESLLCTLRLDYPDFEVIVCNDGSIDRTLEVLIRDFSLFEVHSSIPTVLPSEPLRGIYKSRRFKNLTVIDKLNGGKADSLNACINQSHYPLICCVDSDSLLDADGLARVALPFFQAPEEMIATGGTIYIANTKIKHGESFDGRVATSIPFSWMGMIQAVEYVRAFLVGRMGWDYLGCNTIISGAFGLFQKEAVIRVGGYNCDTIGEDMELLLRMHRYRLLHKEKYKVQFLPDPTCWTEAPSDLKTLGSQRSRWQQGLCESLWQNRVLLFSRRGGRIGWLAMPYLWLYEIFSAPLELIGYFVAGIGIWLDLVSAEVVILLLLVSVVYGWFLTLGAIIIEQMTFAKYKSNGDVLKLLIGAALEQLGFRQIHLFWRLRGMIRWLQGDSKWGAMKRKGFSGTAELKARIREAEGSSSGVPFEQDQPQTKTMLR
jgi:cellulose synthase/poly-beta-1,6-N-acetylglucosamine synthase-like glycosyltransferase